MKKWHTILFLVMTLLVAACGGDNGDAAGETDTGETEAEAEATAMPEEDATVTAGDAELAAVIKGLDNPFFGAMRDGIAAEAEDAGVSVEVQAAQSLDDLTGQADRLAAMAGQDFDCFIVNPISETNLVQPLADVAGQDVPVVNIDLPIAAEAADQVGLDLATYIGTDNVEAGRVAGDFMTDTLGGSGTVALIGGIEGDPTSQARLDGFTEAATDLEVVTTVAGDWDRQTALTRAETILNNNPDLGGFFAANDIMALGISQAIANAGMTGEVAVVGVDGIEDALQAVAEGQLTGTVSQYPYVIGLMGVDACLAAAAGEDIPDDVDAPVQLVTSENATDAIESFPLPPAPYENPFVDAQ